MFFYKKGIETIFEKYKGSVDFRILNYKVPKIEEFFTGTFSKNNNSRVEICNHKISTRLWELEIKENKFDYFFGRTQEELDEEFKKSP